MGLRDDVHALLGRAGPRLGAELRRVVGASKSAFQRAVHDDRDLLVVGKARATSYALRRDVAGVVTPIDVFEVDRTGDARLALTVHPVHPFGCYVEGHVADVVSGWHEVDRRDPGPVDLPWFLDHLVPAGFLGRAWLRGHGGPGFPADLARWQGDDVLRYATTYGADAGGALVLGRFALDVALHRPPVALPPGTERETFPREADRVLAAAVWGSSAGGDQPKFTVATGEGANTRSWIVKFSPPVDQPGGRRWADLLVAEHLVHALLREHGLETPRSVIVDAGGRRFLQVERFDRHGVRGRSGLVSLRPFDRAGVATDLRPWSLVTADLVAAGRLGAEDHERVGWLEAFGDQIANIDMHLGNLSLRLKGTRIVGLAPIYDMLPMFYAPRHGGELPRGRHRPERDAPPIAVLAARELWRRLLDRADVSEEFKAIAIAHLG